MLQCFLELRGLSAGNILCESDNMIPKPPHTAYSCGKHGSVTRWFGRHGQATLYLFEKHILWGWEYIVYRHEVASVKVNFVFY